MEARAFREECMLTGRRLHEHIRARIEVAMAGRPLTWLVESSGVPQSTLSGQMLRSKFSLEVLLRVAEALEKDLAFFLPDDRPPPRCRVRSCCKISRA
jgi:hypothetical protein